MYFARILCVFFQLDISCINESVDMHLICTQHVLDMDLICTRYVVHMHLNWSRGALTNVQLFLLLSSTILVVLCYKL